MNESALTSVESPGISVTLNSLCARPLSQYFIVVLFGVRRLGENDCVYTQSVTVTFGDDRDVFVPVDVNKVIIPTTQTTDYEYCARVSLNGQDLLNSMWVFHF